MKVCILGMILFNIMWRYQENINFWFQLWKLENLSDVEESYEQKNLSIIYKKKFSYWQLPSL